jgi:hypothetical protein
MNKIETYFTMQSGKAFYQDIEKFRGAIASLPDGYYTNTIKKIYNNRTNPQNAYYWAVVLPIVRDGLKDVGYECDTVEEAHEFCKNQFIVIKGRKRKRLINKHTGEIKYVNIFPSTKKLSTVEFNEYFEKIIQWAAEYLGCSIPYPNEILQPETA